jgi:hypothetical protein
VFENLKPLLAANGVLFGATILGNEGVYAPFERYVLRLGNRTGIFDNLADDLNGLSEALQRSFPVYKLWKCGHVALFVASRSEKALLEVPDAQFAQGGGKAFLAQLERLPGDSRLLVPTPHV